MINRLLSIIYILMNKGTVTATELADPYGRFTVTSMHSAWREFLFTRPKEEAAASA